MKSTTNLEAASHTPVTVDRESPPHERLGQAMREIVESLLCIMARTRSVEIVGIGQIRSREDIERILAQMKPDQITSLHARVHGEQSPYYIPPSSHAKD